MAKEFDPFGRIEEIEIDESAAIAVEQIDDEITIASASVVSVHFHITAAQALKLSRALAVAAETPSPFGLCGVRQALAHLKSEKNER